MDRRDFGKNLALAAAAASLWGACKGDDKPSAGGSGGASAEPSPKPSADAAPAKPAVRPMPDLEGFDTAQAAVLIASLDRLFPAAHGLPSASDAHVAVYIDRQLLQPKYAGLAQILKRGLKTLDGVCKRDHKVGFATADEAAQDDVLQRFQTGKASVRRFNSRRFFQILLTLGMEGYMGHPVHGGNEDAVAWRAVGIQWPETLGTTHHGTGHP